MGGPMIGSGESVQTVGEPVADPLRKRLSSSLRWIHRRRNGESESSSSATTRCTARRRSM